MSHDIEKIENAIDLKNSHNTTKYFVDKSKVLPDIDFAKMRIESIST